MSTMPKSNVHVKLPLSVCVINYNTREDLRGCLTSLLTDVQEMPGEVIVVDNASSDGSAELVAREFPAVKLLLNSRNVGFGRAANRALRERTQPYVLLLNPDVTAKSNALAALYRFAREHSDAAAVCGRLVSPDGTFQHYYYYREAGFWRSMIALANALTWNVRNRRLASRHWVDVAGRDSAVVDHLIGGCLLLAPQALADVGLFDEDFFLWFEDDEWCGRARMKGWKLYYCAEAEFTHVGGTSTASWNERKRMGQWLTSYLMYMDKQYPAAAPLLLKPLLALNLLVYLAALMSARLVNTGVQRKFAVRDRLNWIRLATLSPSGLRHRAEWERAWPAAAGRVEH